jgi:hypothetical protein
MKRFLTTLALSAALSPLMFSIVGAQTADPALSTGQPNILGALGGLLSPTGARTPSIDQPIPKDFPDKPDSNSEFEYGSRNNGLVLAVGIMSNGSTMSPLLKDADRYRNDAQTAGTGYGTQTNTMVVAATGAHSELDNAKIANRGNIFSLEGGINLTNNETTNTGNTDDFAVEYARYKLNQEGEDDIDSKLLSNRVTKLENNDLNYVKEDDYKSLELRVDQNSQEIFNNHQNKPQ